MKRRTAVSLDSPSDQVKPLALRRRTMLDYREIERERELEEGIKAVNERAELSRAAAAAAVAWVLYRLGLVEWRIGGRRRKGGRGALVVHLFCP